MYIPNHEAAALRILNSLNADNAHQVAHVLGLNAALEAAKYLDNNPMDGIFDVINLWAAVPQITMEEAENLAHWALDKVERSYQQRLERNEKQLLTKTLNRCRYLKEQVFVYYEYEREQTKHRRWRFITELRSAGLLALVAEDKFGKQDTPVAIQVMNKLPVDPLTKKREPIPDTELDKMLDNGVAVSGLRLGWNINHPAWGILTKAFPEAPDLAAYSHSLNAPILPMGYYPDITMRFARIDADGKDQKTDGSGVYNADHPMFADFIMKYGAAPFQLRAINPDTGEFVKGALRPVNLGEDGPPLICDWNQTKGLHKKDALKKRDDNLTEDRGGFYMGIMQVWNKRNAKNKACFELLENIKVNEETIDIVKDLVDEAIQNLVKGTDKQSGLDRLVRSVARDDENVNRIIQLVYRFRQLGGDIQATQIPMIQSAIKQKLGRKLWHIAQGAGVKFNQRVCFLDDTVEPGTIVAWGAKIGTTVTAFRFPLVLAQGLRVLDVVEPSEHQLVNNQIPINAVFMHPQDLTVGMQGDDDGDIIGISDDPRMLKLFQHIIDDNIYHIEPKGKKVKLLSTSREGLLYIRQDQRGPVGVATNFRSDLLALGPKYVQAANAMSIMIQESVDKAKRIIDWSNFRVAADLQTWECVGQNEYTFKQRIGEMSDKKLKKAWKSWVSMLIMDEGHIAFNQYGNEIPQNVSAWRNSEKFINPETWAPCTQRSKFKGGNLVHICHDYAFSKYKHVADEFELDKTTVQLRDLLPQMLDHLGVEYNILTDDWDRYNRTLRKKSGISAWGAAYKRIKKDGLEEDTRHAQIDMALLSLRVKLEQLNLDEIMTIWYNELNSEDNSSTAGLNNAFRAISTPGNVVLEKLGINEEPTCTFWDKIIDRERLPEHILKAYPGRRINRLQAATQNFMQDENPHERMVAAVFRDTNHAAQVMDANGEPVPLHACPHCVRRISDSVVSAIRNNKSSGEVKWSIEFHGLMK